VQVLSGLAKGERVLERTPERLPPTSEGGNL
jgi:hypothetical protein